MNIKDILKCPVVKGSVYADYRFTYFVNISHKLYNKLEQILIENKSDVFAVGNEVFMSIYGGESLCFTKQVDVGNLGDEDEIRQGLLDIIREEVALIKSVEKFMEKASSSLNFSSIRPHFYFSAKEASDALVDGGINYLSDAFFKYNAHMLVKTNERVEFCDSSSLYFKARESLDVVCEDDFFLGVINFFKKAYSPVEYNPSEITKYVNKIIYYFVKKKDYKNHSKLEKIYRRRDNYREAIRGLSFILRSIDARKYHETIAFLNNGAWDMVADCCSILSDKTGAVCFGEVKVSCLKSGIQIQLPKKIVEDILIYIRQNCEDLLLKYI